MTTAGTTDLHPKDLAARLRELLTQIENAVAAPRSDPRAQRQHELCAEIESILRARSEARPRQG
ncbi:hypothetical protein [Agrococcus sp. DT81.2]|uniref:hypothetical protein n=1 Tax=Agrococcus sp. DT81.2 TaxID=3393414 RepID=UPI003CE5C7E4